MISTRPGDHGRRGGRGEAVPDPADMNAFLASVEKRAFHLARFAVGHSDDALDIVQDAMLALVRRYGDRPRDEWRPLFFRILQSRIGDHHRRSSVRRRWFGWLGGGPDEDGDGFDQVPDPAAIDPAASLDQDGAADAVGTAVSSLPLRQQQAFLLRTLEGLSVAETAAAMGCSQGSVKTHYSRAVQTLRQSLQEHEP
ncbi:MAG: RNA polymerase sigma factor [Pseudomonadales bacterium]